MLPSALNKALKTIMAEVVATDYQPTTAEVPAIYAQGGMIIPADVKEVITPFRIVLPDTEAKMFDVPVKVE